MADCRCVHVLTFCVFTQIFLLCVAQNTHMQNVAKYKPCAISSVYSSSNNCSAAINGNTNTFYQTNPPNCIHTAEGDKSPFWWVDLGEEVTISMITIYGRLAFINRMPCVNVSVDGVVIKRFTDVSAWTNYTYNIPVLRGVRVVNITKDCDSNGPWINICEVQVWVCDDGWYEDCTKSCGQCNNNIACDKVDGRCTSCQTGFQPPLCQECTDGYYETSCSQTCGNCGNSSVCDKTTGWCTSCQTGFNPPYCKECADGWYGTNCSQTCGNCISSSDCNKTTGRCTSYQTGFNMPLCKVGMSCDNNKETVSVAGPVAGAAVGGAVIFFIIGAIFGWWLRKSRSQQLSPNGISRTSDIASRSTSRPDEGDNTSDYINIGYSTNDYDVPNAPDDDNTATYTSLGFYTNAH